VTALTPDERAAKIAKLPVWAREEFDRLNRRLDEARDVARELTAGEADGWTDTYGEFPRPVLPTGQRLRFPLDLSGHDWIDVRRNGDGVEIMASSGLVIRPQVTNVVNVQLDER
jgi:hypothetical protein